MKRLPLVMSFILFIALCASAAYWAMQFWRPAVRPMAPVQEVAVETLSPDAAAGLFGGRPAAVGVATNFELRGVVVADNSHESVAILSANGKPAQAVGVNTDFQPGVQVREVHRSYILVSDGGVVKRVPLPEVADTPLSAFNPTVGTVQNTQSAPAQAPQVVNAPGMLMPPPAGMAMPNPGAPGTLPAASSPRR